MRNKCIRRPRGALFPVRPLFQWVMIGFLVVTAPPVFAATPAERLSAFFTETDYASDWFAPSFAKAVPVARIAEIVSELTKKHGAFRTVERRQHDYLVRFANAAVPAEIAFDADGRITTLLFRDAEPEFANADAVRAAFGALPGVVALLVEGADGEPIAVQPDKPLSVASAFKLAVLAALDRDVSAGRRSWDQTIELKEGWRSLPSGMLQGWPAGQHLTLESMANLMISISDNTAADALLTLVGQDAVEALAPGNVPFLDTRSLFVLKASANAALRRAYLAGDADARRKVLAEAAARPVPEAAEVAQARTPGLGWFFSSRELCALARRVAGLPAMQINPGLATPSAWKSVAFKGGGDTGVLNLTTVLEDFGGRQLCVAATWNDEATLDKKRFFTLYSALLRFLRPKT